MPIREVLIIDDERDMVEVMGFILASRGYKVQAAFDGQQAIDHLEGSVPDLIFLDLEMPRLSGFDVCEQLKNHPRLQKVPLVILTACTLNREEQNRLNKMKINGCVQKPFEIEEIFSVIEQCS